MKKNKNFKKTTNTDKKPVNNTNKNMEKPKTQVFYKKFDTFADAWEELNRIPGGPAELLPGYDKNDGNPYYAQKILMDIFNDNIPDIELGKNQFWQINITSIRSSLKTGMYFAFGWYIEYEKEKEGNIIKSVELSFTSYNQFKTVNEVNFLTEHNWVER